MGGIFFPSEDTEPTEDTVLAEERARQREKARKLMSQRLQILRRRRGGTVGQQDTLDSQDLIGG